MPMRMDLRSFLAALILASVNVVLDLEVDFLVRPARAPHAAPLFTARTKLSWLVLYPPSVSPAASS